MMDHSVTTDIMTPLVMTVINDSLPAAYMIEELCLGYSFKVTLIKINFETYKQNYTTRILVKSNKRNVMN